MRALNLVGSLHHLATELTEIYPVFLLCELSALCGEILYPRFSAFSIDSFVLTGFIGPVKRTGLSMCPDSLVEMNITNH